MLKKLFGGGKAADPRPKKIIKAEKKITNMYVQRADRQYWLDTLRQEGSEEAARTLLKRFTVVCDNSTVDREEKELTAHYLVDMGEAAIGPVKEFIRTRDMGVNWPFRALQRMLPEDQVVIFLAEVLESIGPEYVRDPERKEQLLLTAKGFDDERLIRACIQYLDDDNETIRYVAAETVIHFGNDFLHTPLADRLVEELSNRIVSHIANAFATNDWDVIPSDSSVDLAELVPEGFKLVGKKLKKT